MLTYFRFIAISFFLTVALTGFSQNTKIKYGKVNKEDFSYQDEALFKDASAVVLSDVGEASFIYSTSFKLFVKRHIRIKILNENGLEEANRAISYYSKDNIQKIIKVRAQTSNLSLNGKIEKQSLSSKDIYEIDESDGWSQLRLAFPSVQVGSIIEFTYTTVSENIVFLKNWNFQSDLPTVYSEFSALIPESLDYNILYQGGRLIRKYGSQTTNKWTLNNLSAIDYEEAYTTTPLDYMERMRFQLSGYYTSDATSDLVGSGLKFKSLRLTWGELGKELLADVKIRSYLRNSKKQSELASQISSSSEGNREKISKIYSFIQKELKWNLDLGRYPKHSFKELLDKKSGSSADLNLLLVGLLKIAGFEARPALISTRKHGKVFKEYPLLSQFNNLVAYVRVGEEDQLIDVTGRLLPFNVLPKRDLNGLAIVLTDDETKWVNIVPRFSNKQSKVITMDMNDGENIQYNLNVKSEGYFAKNSRQLAIKHGDSYLGEMLSSDFSDFKEEDVALTGLYELNSPFVLKSSFSSSENLDLAEEYAYLQLSWAGMYSENPFKQENRIYPINFGSPFSRNTVITIKLPSGYELQEAPESTFVKLPGDKGSFRYQISNHDPSKIQISSQFKINKAQISQRYYSHVRQLYDLAIAKFSEQIVLKVVSE